jgi:hypothetical protein
MLHGPHLFGRVPMMVENFGLADGARGLLLRNFASGLVRVNQWRLLMNLRRRSEAIDHDALPR